MLASPVPIYLGCAGLIVGSLGLGANHMLGGGSGPSRDVAAEQPLFARSVEQASLPATQWPSTNGNVDVAYYGPMVELLTQPTSSAPAPLADPSRVQATPAPQSAPPSSVPTATAPEESRPAPREVVRDLAPAPNKQTRRVTNQRQKNDARSGNDETAAAETERVDSRDAREGRQRTATQVDAERRESRRADRRYRDRDDSDDADVRSRTDRRERQWEERRSRDGERRVVVVEESREPERRMMPGPAQRDAGFSPFRLFGIFDQR